MTSQTIATEYQALPRQPKQLITLWIGWPQLKLTKLAMSMIKTVWILLYAISRYPKIPVFPAMLTTSKMLEALKTLPSVLPSLVSSSLTPFLERVSILSTQPPTEVSPTQTQSLRKSIGALPILKWRESSITTVLQPAQPTRTSSTPSLETWILTSIPLLETSGHTTNLTDLLSVFLRMVDPSCRHCTIMARSTMVVQSMSAMDWISMATICTSPPSSIPISRVATVEEAPRSSTNNAPQTQDSATSSMTHRVPSPVSSQSPGQSLVSQPCSLLTKLYSDYVF